MLAIETASTSRKVAAQLGRILRAASALGLATALFVAVACFGDGGRELTIENRLPSVIVVYDDGRFVGKIDPQKRFTYPELQYDGTSTYEARAQSGELLASRCFTWDELRQQGMLIVFDAPSAPPGTAGACD